VDALADLLRQVAIAELVDVLHARDPVPTA